MPCCNTDCMNVFFNNLSIEFLEYYIILVCDGATWHKANALVVSPKIRIIHIPPDTPEMNPIEQIWKESVSEVSAMRLLTLLIRLLIDFVQLFAHCPLIQ